MTSGRPVDARRVQAGRLRDRHRRGRVPLVLAARMDVGVGGAGDHGDDLGAGRAERDQVRADLGGERPDEFGGRVRLTTIRSLVGGAAASARAAPPRPCGTVL